MSPVHGIHTQVMLLNCPCRSPLLRVALPVLPAALCGSFHLPRRVQDAAEGARLRHVPPVSLLLRAHSLRPAHGHGHPHTVPAAGLLHGPPALHGCCFLRQLLHRHPGHAGGFCTLGLIEKKRGENLPFLAPICCCRHYLYHYHYR